MEKKSPRKSKKRPAAESPSPSKKQKPRYNNSTVNLSQRIAKAMKDVLVTTLDESFREECLNILGVENGSEAGEKIEELIVKFKDNKRQKAIKEKSEKINENSP